MHQQAQSLLWVSLTARLDVDHLTKCIAWVALTLMAARVCLVVEYAVTLWSLWKFKRHHTPYYCQMAVHFVAAIIFLAVALTIENIQNHHAFNALYVVSGFETIITLLLSNKWKVMSLTKTHLIKRLTLLTVLILGEGVQQIAQEVVLIVENEHSWGE